MKTNNPHNPVMVHTSAGLLPSVTFLEGLFENVWPSNASGVEFSFVDDVTIDPEVEYYIDVFNKFLYHTFRFRVNEHELHSMDCGAFDTEEDANVLASLIEESVEDAAEGMLYFS